MKARSITINAGLNVFRTILSLVVPLITYPYVSRVLGAENLGKVNYVNSIVQYFVLFASLGISTYGIREGAKKRKNINELNNFISECFSINFIMAIASILVLIAIVCNLSIFDKYRILFFIEAFLICFDLFGIEWVNTVFEDYLFITIRTIFVYSVSIVLTFFLIRNQNDYYKYAMLSVGTTGLVSLLNWLHYRKTCKIRLRFTSQTIKHFRPIVIFFANKLAVTIYVSSDNTMLGLMTSDFRVGIYSVAVKIYTIIKTMISSIYAVCIPRLSAKIGEGDVDGYKILFSQIVSAISLLIFPASVGVLCLSQEIIRFLFGIEYMEASISLSILSFGIILSIFGGLISSVYNVTMNLEKISLQATIIAAAMNVLLNLFLIPRFMEVGAAITTVVAEGITFFYCLIRGKGLRNVINSKQVFINLVHASIGCIEIVLITSILKSLALTDFGTIAISIMCSLIVYFFTLIILKNNLVIHIVENFIIKIRGHQ